MNSIRAALKALVARRRPPRNHTPSRKPRLFSNNPEDVTLRSADNLRLLSDEQLRACEDE